MAHARYLRLQTHTQYVIIIAFPQQEWFHEGVSVLRYSQIVCLVGNVRLYSNNNPALPLCSGRACRVLYKIE